ncbi:MAG: cob(I)yrinic acid a,c-diamide adenosyltransferase [Bacteroidales bacterium]|nr:cob(I)yrinic acid a,c-diamide adenosyltransferase [Bacteroidales bacterium]
MYTKTGDKGKTALLTGKRVPKYHPRIEAYGTIDELNSFIGLLRAYDINTGDKEVLERIQNLLFNIGSNLASDEKKTEFGIPDVSDENIAMLEREMDRMDEILPKLNAFIIPGGDKAVAVSHVCRSVCRRAERLCVELSENEFVDELIIIYLNRLSDYFFMLGRKIAFDKNIEIPEWDSKL